MARFKEEVKDSKFLWQKAAENAQRGIFNEPPQTLNKKIYSYSK